MNTHFFFTKKLFFIMQYLCITFVLLKCGYQLSTNLISNIIDVTDNTPLKILLYSDDPFNMLTRMIKDELILNNIIIFNDSYDIKHQCPKQLIPCLEIVNVSKNYVIVSVFPDGTKAEYQIILNIQAQFFIPNQKNYRSINISVCRTFIHNYGLALSDLTQENEIINEMYQNIAQKLIQKFLIQINN